MSNYKHALRAYIQLGQKTNKQNKTKEKKNGDCCYHNRSHLKRGGTPKMVRKAFLSLIESQFALWSPSET